MFKSFPTLSALLSFLLSQEKKGNQPSPLPIPLPTETPVISREENPLHWKFLPPRNDTLLNNYIPLLMLAWSANIDVLPCTNSYAVLQYIAKYALKSEKKSETYQDMFAAVAIILQASIQFYLQQPR